MLAREFKKSSMAFASQKTINTQLQASLNKSRLENKELSESLSSIQSSVEALTHKVHQQKREEDETAKENSLLSKQLKELRALHETVIHELNAKNREVESLKVASQDRISEKLANESLETSIVALQDEKKVLERDLNFFRSLSKQQKKEISVAREALSRTETELARFSVSFEELEAQRQSDFTLLQEKLGQALRERDEAINKFKKASREVHDLRVDLEDRNQEEENLRDEYSRICEEAAEVNRMYQQISLELNDAQKFQRAAQKEIQGLRIKHHEACEEVNAASDKIQELRGEIKSSNSELRNVKEAYTSLTVKYEEARNEIGETKARFEQSRDEISALSVKYDEARAEIRALTVRYEQSRDEVAQGHQEIQELQATVEADSQRYEMEITKLESELQAEVTSRSAEREESKKLLEASELNYSNFREMSEAEFHRVTAELQAANSEVATLTATCAEHCVKITDLECHVETLQQDLKEMNETACGLQEARDAAFSELQRFAAALSQLEVERDQLKVVIEQSKTELEDVRQNYLVMCDAVTTLESERKSELERFISSFGQLEKERDQLKVVIEQSKTELEDVRQNYLVMCDAVTTLESERKSELERFTSSFGQLEKERDQLKEDLGEICTELENLRQDYSVMCDAVTTLESEHKSELERYASSFGQLEKERDQFKEDLEVTNTELENLRQNYSVMCDTVTTLDSDVNQRNSELETLANAYVECTTKIAELESCVEVANNRIEISEFQARELRSELGASQTQLEMSNSEVEAARKELEILRFQVSTLLPELEVMKARDAERERDLSTLSRVNMDDFVPKSEFEELCARLNVMTEEKTEVEEEAKHYRNLNAEGEAQLVEVMKQMTSWQMEASLLSGKLSSASEEINALREQLADSMMAASGKVSAEEFEAQTEAIITSKDSEISSLRAEISQLRLDLVKTQQVAAQSESELKAVITEREAQLSQLMVDNSKEDANNEEAKQMVMKMKHEISMQGREADRLRGILQNRETQINTLKDELTQLHDRWEATKQMKEEIEQKNAEISALQAKQRKLQAMNLAQKDKISAAEKAELQIAELKKTISRERVERENVAAQLLAAETEAKELRVEMMTKMGATDYLKKMKEELVLVKKENAQLKATVDRQRKLARPTTTTTSK